VGALLSAHMKKHPEEARAWRVLTKKSLSAPIALPVVMTTAPRWNPHALISTSGPFPVKGEMRIYVESAERSTAFWTIVVYSMPGRKTVASVGSLDGPAPGGWRTVPLRSGEYGLAARYYGWKQEVELPTIEADGIAIVQASRQLSGSNDLYDDLRGRNGLFYRCLHYYVYTMLQFRSHLPAGFVERNYLPVGNPETEFFYGALNRGEILHLELDPAVSRSFGVYLTVYNRASFPILWHSVAESPHSTIAMTRKASYLVRIHKIASGGPAFDRSWIRVTTTVSHN
jgi:hypothetical protein